ncbi:MAG: tripartite tricarboxylate transporter substrate binding protein [Betaproteobacteria bacterium]|nr:tripartite tricarboxylate transporter substrate binding protein [Betaproteobacteria bacterium]
MIRIPAICLMALFFALPATAQYPERPLTILAGYPAGGMVDIVARLLAEGMKAKFPKGVLVLNRTGAGGAVAAAEVAVGKPDGYTIVLTPLSTLVIQPQILDLRFKTPDDYEPILNVVSYYPLLVVQTEARWKSVQEFVAEAKANPGKMRVGTPGEGTSSHLNLEEFMHVTGIKMTHVPYRGWGESSPALLGGHIEAIVAQPGEAKPMVDGKRMRALVVFQNSRHPAFPDGPTAKELGWNVANGVWFLLMAPKGTPAPIVRYLHDAAKTVMEDPAFAGQMALRGIDVDYRPGDKLRTDLWREYKLHTDILRRIGMIK